MRYVMGTALAAGLWLAVGGATWGQDTVRLGGPSAQADISGGIDTELVHRRGGYYGGGYSRGYYGGGYYGGYGVRYASPYYSVGFYSSPYYGYYDPYYYNSYYRPYRSGCYRPYYSGSYYSGSYYYPIAGEMVPPPGVTLQSSYQTPSPQPYVPPMLPASQSGPFPYDGGPRNQVPMPNANPAPRNVPYGIVPIDGRLVSMPTGVSGGVSPVGTITTRPVVNQPRVVYPAYGETPIPTVPR